MSDADSGMNPNKDCPAWTERRMTVDERFSKTLRGCGNHSGSSTPTLRTTPRCSFKDWTSSGRFSFPLGTTSNNAPSSIAFRSSSEKIFPSSIRINKSVPISIETRSSVCFSGDAADFSRWCSKPFPSLSLITCSAKRTGRSQRNSAVEISHASPLSFKGLCLSMASRAG